MFRSKSRSQIAAGGTQSISPPPSRPGHYASSLASNTHATNTLVKNILKNVDSHVRVMSHLENISISSSYTALRLRKPKNRRGGHGEGSSSHSQPTDASGGDEEWSAPFTVSRVHRGVVSAASASPPRSQDANGPNPSSNSTNNGSTFAFYSDVIAPCVSNCCAGQSYMFLFNGPQESGRSQTLYGCPSKQSKHGAVVNPSQDPKLYPGASEDGNERGVVELAALDFLERVLLRQRQRMAAEEAVYTGATQESDKENRGVHGAHSNPASQGGLVVTFSAFTTRGDHVVDTITKKEVKMESFPPPLGTVALPYMHLLDEQSIESFSFSSSSTGKAHQGDHKGDGSAVREVVPILPEKKYIDTSCIVQFQVYACVDGGGAGANHSSSSGSPTPGAGLGKRTMATFTFVDMAAFRAPVCKEVTSVVETVRKVAGLSSDGGDSAPSSQAADALSTHKSNAKNDVSGSSGEDNKHAAEDFFKSTKLTQLLEPALTGYVTLVSVTTISGREDLYDGACAALSFAQDIKKIHQVFFLLHIITPRWLFDTACALENLREERDRTIKGSYAQGVYDYYKTASKWLSDNVSDVEGQLQKLLDETEDIRKGIEQEVQVQERTLQASVEKETASAKKATEDARRAQSQSTAQFETLKRLDEELAHMEQKLAHTELKASQRIGEMRLEINALEAKKSSREKEVAQLQRERSLFDSKSEEVVSVVRKYAEDLAFAQVSYSCQHEMQSIARKRSRLERDLEMASVVAHQATDSLRSDRERRAMISRLTATQQRVASLRLTVQNTLAGGGFDALSDLLNEEEDNHGDNGSTEPRPAKKANTMRR